MEHKEQQQQPLTIVVTVFHRDTEVADPVLEGSGSN